MREGYFQSEAHGAMWENGTRKGVAKKRNGKTRCTEAKETEESFAEGENQWSKYMRRKTHEETQKQKNEVKRRFMMEDEMGGGKSGN